MGRYKIKTVAELFELSPTLLRAWERRYGLLQPQRLPSGHRLYTEDDLAVLSRVRDLMHRGRSIGEIAAEGRERLLGQARTPEPSEVAREYAPAEQFKELHVALLAAAVHLKRDRFVDLLDQAFEEHDQDEVLLGLLGPLLGAIGELWSEGRLSVAAEHMVSALLRERLQACIAALPRATSEPKVLLAGLPDEYHEMGPLLLLYVLRKEGLNVVYLGAALPLEDLERSIQEIRPRAVLLSVTREAVFLVHYQRLLEMVKRCPGTQFVVGGQGVSNRGSELGWRGVEHWPMDRPLRELPELVAG